MLRYRSAAPRREAAILALCFIATTLAGAFAISLVVAPTALAADPAAGYDATWTVTRPDASVRTDDAIAVGDDLYLEYAAVDGTPVTACRVRMTALGGGMMETPGVIDDDVCRLSVRLPDFPDQAQRAAIGEINPGSVALDLCVWVATITFADAAPRAMSSADQLMPGGEMCNNWVDGTDPSRLDLAIDPSGERRAFESDPYIVSWDPTDWGTGMTPLRFGEPWTWEIPAGIERCRLWLNGSWTTSIQPRAGAGCSPWTLRLPGVLPSTLPWDGGPGDWYLEMHIDYTVAEPGPGSWTITQTSVPYASSDGVFESSLASIFPVDLATTRFVTEGERWTPSFQVGGATATTCTLTMVTVPPGWPDDPIQTEYFDVSVDGDGVCTFDLDPLVAWESHQYSVTPHLTVGDDPNLHYGGNVSGIPAPEPPVIDPPVEESDGDTGLEVEAGDGQGLAVDLDVTPTTAATAMIATAAAACSDRSISTDLASGGSIPRLETSCDLPPGTYKATARMVDAAGVVTTANRTFTVLAPRPVVSGRSPGSGATGVARDIRPTVVFDVSVKGISSTSMNLRDLSTGALVPAAVTYNASTRRATLKPDALLVAGRNYRLFLTTAVKSVSGNRPIAPISWEFRVSTDATKPTIVGRSPAVGATGLARTSVIAVRFSETVKSVTTTTFQLRDTVTGAYVPAVVTYDAVTRRATLDPTVTLTAGRTYLAIVRSGIIDKVGNPLTTTTWSFRTGN